MQDVNAISGYIISNIYSASSLNMMTNAEACFRYWRTSNINSDKYLYTVKYSQILLNIVKYSYAYGLLMIYFSMKKIYAIIFGSSTELALFWLALWIWLGNLGESVYAVICSWSITTISIRRKMFSTNTRWCHPFLTAVSVIVYDSILWYIIKMAINIIYSPVMS